MEQELSTRHLRDFSLFFVRPLFIWLLVFGLNPYNLKTKPTSDWDPGTLNPGSKDWGNNSSPTRRQKNSPRGPFSVDFLQGTCLRFFLIFRSQGTSWTLPLRTKFTAKKKKVTAAGNPLSTIKKNKPPCNTDDFEAFLVFAGHFLEKKTASAPQHFRSSLMLSFQQLLYSAAVCCCLCSTTWASYWWVPRRQFMFVSSWSRFV